MENSAASVRDFAAIAAESDVPGSSASSVAVHVVGSGIVRGRYCVYLCSSIARESTVDGEEGQRNSLAPRVPLPRNEPGGRAHSQQEEDHRRDARVVSEGAGGGKRIVEVAVGFGSGFDGGVG